MDLFDSFSISRQKAILKKRLNNLSLRAKFIVALLTLGAFAVITISFFARQTTTRALEQATGKELHNLADFKALAVGDLLARQIDALHSLSLNRTPRARLLGANNTHTGELAAIQGELQELERQWIKADDADLLIQTTLNNTAATELHLSQTRFPDHVGAIVGRST